MNEVNGESFTHSIVVYDLRNYSDMTGMGTGFKEYDYVRSVRWCRREERGGLRYRTSADLYEARKI
jgi:hypothetical protein